MEAALTATMRVCLPFVGDTVGGSHLSALLLARGLGELGVHVHVVVHRPGPLSELLERRGTRFELLPLPTVEGAGTRLGYLRATAASLGPLRHHLRTNRIDVVHTNDLRIHRAWMIAARTARVPHVWHQRTRFFAPRFGRLQLHAPTRIIAISRFVDESLPPFARRKSTVVLNPFDTLAEPPDRAAARRDLLAEIGAPASARIVGIVGNLTDQKRPLLFVEVAGRLAAESDDLVFVMAGSDRSGNAARVERLADESGISGRVHHLGFRSPIEPVIAGCDVLVAPGVDDGFGRALVEAMLVGTPVVASRSGGHREVVEDGSTGLLVAPDDAAATAAAVRRLLEDPALGEAMTARAAAQARERYSIRRHAEDVLAVYRSLP